MRKPLFLYVAVLLFVMPLFAKAELANNFVCQKGEVNRAAKPGYIGKTTVQYSPSLIDQKSKAVESNEIVYSSQEDDSPIPLEWEGEFPWVYTGTGEYEFNGKENLHINKFSKNETSISGTIDIKFYTLDGSFYSSGTAAFRGSYDDQARTIYLETTNWTKDPATDERFFNLFSFESTISENYKEIECGYKSKFVKFYIGFKLGTDNNKFTNNNGKSWFWEDGFHGTATYQLSPAFFQETKKRLSSGQVSLLQKSMVKEWRGACFGISATMMFVYEKLLTLWNIAHEAANSYYKLKPPKDNLYLKDVLNYYQLTQKFVDPKNTSRVSPDDFFKDLEKHAIKELKQKNPVMLGVIFKVDNKTYCESGAHAILITGYEYEKSKGAYRLQICDPNEEKFGWLTVSEDYNSFGYNNIKKIYELYYWDADNFYGVLHTSYNATHNIKTSYSSSDTLDIIFSEESFLRFTSADGRSLIHDKSGISGDLPILSDAIVPNGNGFSIKIKTQYCENFKIIPTSKKIDFELISDENFKAIAGENIREIKVSMNGDMTFSGKSFSFRATTNIDKNIDNYEKGMGSIYAKGKGEVIIHKGQDTIEATSDNPMSNVETKIYQGVEVIEGKIKGKQNSVVIKPCEETNGTSGSIEDGMIIFAKSGYAYRGRPIKPFVSVYVGGKSLKKNKEFKVQYENNVEVGTGTLIVTGVGEYSGSLTAEFPIIPKKVKVKKVTSCQSGFEVTWKASGPKDGFEIQYATDLDFKNVETMKIEDSESSSAQVEGLEVGGEYFVRIRAYKTEAETGKTYNSNWSDVKNVLIYPY